MIALCIVILAISLYAECMKHSTVFSQEPPEMVDVARIVRGRMGEERLTASDLSRMFGGAVTYWTRRTTDLVELSARDVQLLAWALRLHPAELMGGEAPAGWTAPPPPPTSRATMDESARSSTDRASDYGSLVRLPHRPILTLIQGRAS